MQVLQWLLKISQDQKQTHQSKEEINTLKEKEKSKEIARYKHKRVHKKPKRPEQTSLDCKNFRYITLLLKRDNSSTAYFSSTIHHKRINNSLDQRQQQQQQQQQQYILTMKMKKDDIMRGLGMSSGHHKADLSNAAHVGNKVLPITDSTTSSLSSLSSLVSTSNADDQQQTGVSDKKEEKVKGISNKAKTLSRMKELLRWAAAAKSDKGAKYGRKVLHFRNKSATAKSGGGFDDQSNNDSPKISFRWEVESCSTTCSAASAPPSLKYDPNAHRRGSWITTDDDFVVLEL